MHQKKSLFFIHLHLYCHNNDVSINVQNVLTGNFQHEKSCSVPANLQQLYCLVDHVIVMVGSSPVILQGTGI